MATLIKPPPEDGSKSAMEYTLELTQLSDIDPDLFTNTRPLWHPPGARGVFGGSVIAQCLAAAQRTVPHTFTIHSMHCYFVLAGNSGIPIVYHVEHVREGKSFATRTVQARQRGKVIFTTTLSFMREGSSGKEMVEHQMPLPDVPVPKEELQGDRRGPYVSQMVPSLNSESKFPHTKRTRHWIKARGRISAAGGHEAHLSALAYMSDSFFIGTVARAHGLLRNPMRARMANDKANEGSIGSGDEKWVREEIEKEIAAARAASQSPREIGMMVSLDHTIYFHRPRGFRADEWLFTEMETPWAGDGRGVVVQRVWSRDGHLIATCFQEGLIRLAQNRENKL